MHTTTNFCFIVELHLQIKINSRSHPVAYLPTSFHKMKPMWLTVTLLIRKRIPQLILVSFYEFVKLLLQILQIKIDRLLIYSDLSESNEAYTRALSTLKSAAI